jgi:hypothetical protein
MSQNNIHGRKGAHYATQLKRYFPHGAVIRYYTLSTADSFEVGDAYSLHKSVQDAEKFKTERWWSPVGNPESVFVSSQTYKKLKRKPIFSSWEN